MLEKVGNFVDLQRQLESIKYLPRLALTKQVTQNTVGSIGEGVDGEGVFSFL
jgi:hypothetical protein